MNISIIIPTYKPQNYLWECLESFKNQTYDKSLFEIILILNGPLDPYKQQIEGFIAEQMNGMNVRFISTEVPGVSNARNLGLNAAKGAYIGFVDDDDYVSSTYLEELYKIATPETIPIAYTISFSDDEQRKLSPYRKTLKYEQRCKYGKQSYNCVTPFFSAPWCKLLHRDIIGTRRFNTNFSNGEDTIFNFEISNRFKYVDFTSKEAVYYWRKRSKSAQSNLKKFSARWNRMIKMNWEFLKIYVPHFWRYDFRFFVTRVLSTIKSLFLNIRRL